MIWFGDVVLIVEVVVCLFGMFWCYVVVSCVYFDVYGMFVMLVELVDYVCLCFYFGVD